MGAYSYQALNNFCEVKWSSTIYSLICSFIQYLLSTYNFLPTLLLDSSAKHIIILYATRNKN